jgi:prephenate dehydratase
MAPAGDIVATVAFLGPQGTFAEEALLTRADLAACALEPKATIGEVLAAVADGSVDRGFVPLENAIEGTVPATIDGLVFDHDLFIVGEVVLDIHLHLMVRPGTRLDQVAEVHSYPHALAQVRNYLAVNVPSARTVAANSTAEAARALAEEGRADQAVVANALCADLYGLEVLANDIEDHAENQTRFVVVARDAIAAPTGQDRTSIVCFQDADRPGSLYGILGQFAARDINLTNLQSRPTKRGLGDYCFIIDLDGHLADQVVSDCLRDLKAHLADVKFLGSYPSDHPQAEQARAAVSTARVDAERWMAELRSRLER